MGYDIVCVAVLICGLLIGRSRGSLRMVSFGVSLLLARMFSPLLALRFHAKLPFEPDIATALLAVAIVVSCSFAFSLSCWIFSAVFGSASSEQKSRWGGGLTGVAAAIIFCAIGTELLDARSTSANLELEGSIAGPAVLDLTNRAIPKLEEWGAQLLANADGWFIENRDLQKAETNSKKSVQIAGIEFVELSGGEFYRGSPNSEPGHEKGEHRVAIRIMAPFAIAKYEITEFDYHRVMGGHASSDPQMPMAEVSYDDAQEFCRRLTEEHGLRFRLPSETEWEYAARGGSEMMFSVWRGDLAAAIESWRRGDENSVKRRARSLFNFDSSSRKRVSDLTDVNGYGLVGTQGNVWEWCSAEDPYAVDDPPSLAVAPIRGGGWTSTTCLDCRPAKRAWSKRGAAKASIGFRIIVDLDTNLASR